MRLPRPVIVWFAIFGAATACAKASPSGQDKPDAKIPGNLDAPLDNPDAPSGNPDAPSGNPDAQPVTMTLSQATSTSIVALNSRACANIYGVTFENSYYRAFPLADFGITGPFNVASVSYAVEAATAEFGASQPVQVKVYNYAGGLGGTTLDTASMSPLANVASMVPNTTTGMMVTANVAATVPAGGTVVAEVFVPNSDPDGDTYGNEFYLGSNAGGESRPGYLRAPKCGTAAPTKIPTLPLNGATVDIIITVTGSYVP
jgi:hypothetical protein